MQHPSTPEYEDLSMDTGYMLGLKHGSLMTLELINEFGLGDAARRTETVATEGMSEDEIFIMRDAFSQIIALRSGPRDISDLVDQTPHAGLCAFPECSDCKAATR